MRLRERPSGRAARVGGTPVRDRQGPCSVHRPLVLVGQVGVSLH